jgi:prepilin-type N-terminal cleavage/methylation domain-containing protein/prepilin-type processing-associated H-X9-DG protein
MALKNHQAIAREGFAHMPSRTDRTAFTLVELLVVIAIIGVLMGLLLPAVQSAREAGRRVTCTNSQYQMAFAAIRFNESNGFLPGWRNALQATGTVFSPSWPVMILPFVERNDIYKAWQATAAGGIPPAPYVSLFVCPSTPPDSMTNPVLAYAANCGTGTSSVALKANGVMVDTAWPGTAASRLALDEISSEDGTTMTLLFSEKCISGTAGLNQNWWDTRPTTPGAVGTSSFSFLNPSATYAAPSAIVPGFGIVGTAIVAKVINNALPGSASVAGQINLPSSNHPGGAVVAFCDGRTGFLKDSLAQNVYGRLVTSDGLAASALGSANPAAALVWSGITPPAAPSPLSEGDFQ